MQYRNLLPKAAQYLEKNSTIKILEFKSFINSFTLKDEINLAIEEKKFGKAADLLRFEVINTFGGGYLDIDLQTFHSLKLLFHKYDFLSVIEPMSSWISNAFFAAKPNHPILNECIRLIKRNCNPKTQLPYINKSSGPFSTIVLTGPSIFSTAVYNDANTDNLRNLVAPPTYFCPRKTGKYPELEIAQANDPADLTSFMRHLFYTTWVKQKYGSKG